MAYSGQQRRYQEPQYQARPPHTGRNPGGYQQQDQYGYNIGNYQPQSQYPHDQQYNEYQQNGYGGYDQYDQYDQHYGQSWDQTQYQGQHYDYNESGYPDAYAQQPHHDQREYQYDDRYRTNRQDEYAAHHGRPHQQQNNRRSPQNSRPGTSASNRKIKKERILDTLHNDEPKAMAWDTPFAVFPGTKKDMEKKKKDTDQSRSRSRADAPVDRPATASSSRIAVNDQQQAAQPPPVQTVEYQQRPHTSHGARPQPAGEVLAPFNQSLGPLDNMPIRKTPGNQLQAMPEDRYTHQAPHSATTGTFDLPLPRRPAPQRTASGPVPGQQLHPVELSSSPPASARPAMNGSSNGYRAQRPAPNPAELPYRGAAPTGPVNTSPEPVMPNFDAMAPGTTESVERGITLQSPPAVSQAQPTAYRKPTYGDATSRPPPIRPGLTQQQLQPADVPDQLQSPLSDFDFGLGSQSEPQRSGHPPSAQNSFPPAQGGRHGQPSTNAQNNFPPRNASRAETKQRGPANGFSHPYNQPPPSRHALQGSSQNQGYPSQREEYGFNDHGYPQAYPQNSQSGNEYDAGHDRMKPLARTRTEPINDYGHRQNNHYDHGYDTRSPVEHPKSRRYGSDPDRQDPYVNGQNPNRSYDQFSTPDPAQRPRTANSGRPPVRQYTEQALPPNSGLPLADRNHPVPIRPGLINPSPQSASQHQPQSQPKPQSQPQPQPQPRAQAPPAVQGAPPAQRSGPATGRTSPPKVAVTPAELNDYRIQFNGRPNDDKLGLKFAKRLLEASIVLADNGGQADAKTTAKNRERYVNDAYKIVKRLVANGSPDAMFYLADCYGQGQLGLEPNSKEAYQLYTSAAKMGHAQAAYRVAVCCELGPDGGGGTRRDHVKAVQFYKRAATLGDGPAMFKMGMILLKGLLGQQPNRREAISWLKRAAERADADNPHALHELGTLYETAPPSDVIVRDEAYALSLFTQAANLGYKYSQHRLGSAFEYGTLGVAIDPRQSIAWYSKAAAQGEHQAEFALSGWYLTGSEPLLAQSDTEAYLWARKAAQTGLAKAEYAMGYYTEVGIGCAPNLEEAKKWYFRAAAQLDNRAKERLEEIKRGGKRKEKTRISRSHVGRQNEGECSVM